jgi:tetratricopeptide (TPR) repeat protein
MTLEEFVSQGLADHADQTEAVFARLPEGVALVTAPEQIPSIAHLVAHVCGEHLGRWDDGIALLERLEQLPVYDATSPSGKAVQRQKAVLHRCAGRADEEARCFEAARSVDVPEASDRIRVLAVASTALLFQKRLDEARRDFEECVRLAAYGPENPDPAARALAVTGHNIAVDLENRAELTDDERALMLRAAEVSRDFWNIAGGWMESERAEYRLAMSRLKAGDAAGALGHAENCLRIVEENGSDAGESFFAHEAIARARLASGDVDAARAERETMATLLPAVADESFRGFCAQELAKLDAALPGAATVAAAAPSTPSKRSTPLLKSPWK